MATIIAPKGTKDVGIEESYKWHFIEKTIRDVVAKYGHREIRTPVFEHTDLFLRGVGDTTDIVQKEMYTFLDKGNRSITLKPEGTAGVVRSFVERKLYGGPQPTKMYYLNCPVFRYERPQAGRLREHHQFGIEVFGAKNASLDAEVILVAKELFDTFGITGVELNINSIGCPNCRPAYNEKLKEYLKNNLDNLCKTCNDRYETNPLRILDCKVDSCKEIVADAPTIIESLCDECSDHFDELKSMLEAVGVKYKVNPMIVRGLDYYSKTVFEFVATGIGAQGTVCGGGRYDGLVKQIGGPETAGIGFGMGMERLLLVLESQGIEIKPPVKYDIFICTMGEETRTKAFEILATLRKNGYKADLDHCNRSLKAQFKYANKTGAKNVIVIGGDELMRNVVKLKNMDDGSEQEIKMDELVEKL